MKKPIKSKKLLLCSFFFLCLFNGYSQNKLAGLKLSVKNIGINQGLSQNHINSTFIDRNERIWFISNNKISLFESGQITNHEFTNTFSNKGFNHAVEDAKGNFWLSENFEWFYPFNTQRCLVFNPKTNKTTTAEKYIGRNLSLHSIRADEKGTIFLSTKNGEIYKFEPTKKHLSKISSLGSRPVKILSATQESLIVCIEKSARFDEKIIEIHPEGRVMRTEKVDGILIKSAIRINSKTYFTYEKGQQIGIKEFGGVLIKHFPTSKDSYLASITYNSNKRLWLINRGDGLDFRNENFELIKSNNYDFLIHHVKDDNRGNSFLATNNGIYILRLIEQKIKTYLANPTPEKTNDNYSCRGILKFEDNKIVVNTNRRRQIIDIKNDKITPIGQQTDLNNADSKFILSVLRDKDGEVLFGEDLLLKTNLKTKKNTTLRQLDSTKIWSMANYREGILLGLEKKGIIFYEKNRNTFKNYQITQGNLRSSIIYDIHVIDKDLVLLASEAGFYKLLGDEKFEEIRLPLDKSAVVSFFAIKKSKSDPRNLFLATSKGIWIYNLTSQTVLPFIQDFGSQQKKFLSAYQTNNGVWASSEEGVWHFNDKGILLKIFTETDGLTSKECNRLAHYQDENDVLYFGGVNGLNIIDPKDFPNQIETAFPLTIKNITSYNNQNRNRSDLKILKNILPLERSENSLSISLNYEDFKYDCPKKYYYRSNKTIRKDWIPIVGRTLLLDYVGRGETEIEIKVVSCNNFTESPTINFKIIRPKAIYLEWYFALSVLLFLGLIIWLFNKYTTYKLRLRNESLQRKIDRQTRSLQENLTLKETLLSLLVHDVRYPVQSFYDISKKLSYLTKKNDQERLMLLGKETEEKSRKVLWLIDELVYWVKSTNDKNEVIIQTKNLGEQILHLLEIYKDEITERKLSMEVSNINHSLTANYGLLIIVLRNLIYNAVVHSKPASDIQISLEKEKEKFILKIENQNDSKSRRLKGGLGIGLALLLPLLEKSGMKLQTSQDEETFRAELEIYL